MNQTRFFISADGSISDDVNIEAVMSLSYTNLQKVIKISEIDVINLVERNVHITTEEFNELYDMSLYELQVIVQRYNEQKNMVEYY